mgnify:CR=1 FL=1
MTSCPRLFLSLPLLYLFFLVPAFALAEETLRTVPVQVSQELSTLGVHAASAGIPARPTDNQAKDAPTAEKHAGSGPTAVAFVTFDQSFTGVLHLRGYDKDNAEIARSALLTVAKQPKEGGHLTFSFDGPTKLAGVTRFSLEGEKRAEAPRKPAPRQESAGEEARSILRELLQ